MKRYELMVRKEDGFKCVLEYYVASEVDTLLDEIILCLGRDELKYRRIIYLIEEAKQ